MPVLLCAERSEIGGSLAVPLLNVRGTRVALGRPRLMIPWIETMGVLFLAAAGLGIGHWCSRLPKLYWLLGYVIPLLLIALIGLTRRNSVWEFVPPMSLLVTGRTEFALAGFITALVLTTPLSRLSHARSRIWVMAFMGLVVFFSSVWPFLAPAFNRKQLQSLNTVLDRDGICRQSNEYSCGPAAAVTALRRLGFDAEEGEIAILAHTSTAIGTPPDLLCAALKKRYEGEGLNCEYRHFKCISELAADGVLPHGVPVHGPLTLALIKFSFLVDHYVVILEVTGEHIIVGDPFHGKVKYSHDQFRRKWRNSGVILKRATASPQKFMPGWQYSTHYV